MNKNYLKVFKNIYTNSIVIIQLHKTQVKMGQGMGQGISLKLFTASLETIFWKMN